MKRRRRTMARRKTQFSNFTDLQRETENRFSYKQLIINVLLEVRSRIRYRCCQERRRGRPYEKQ
jgi:hypothetical protein